MLIKEYNRSKALLYAHRYALTRNERYFDFSSLGGDCTNFCSQCLYAGAHRMNYASPFGWYYRSSNDRSASWTGVKFFKSFLTDNLVVNRVGEGYGPFAEERDVRELDVGDFVLLSNEKEVYFHSTVVVGFKGKEPLLASHSRDAFELPLSRFDYNEAKGLHVLGYRD